MDFITNLPNSFGFTVIWVICDRLTKYIHLIALPTKFTSQDLAHRFAVEIHRLHGTPKSIVSDHDPLFLSNFWKEFFKAQGTKLKYSTAYHPETDGQTEVTNRSVETYLRCFVNDHPRKWFKYLHLAELWYNTSFHSAIQMSPFKALYGREPPNINQCLASEAKGDPLPVLLQVHEQILTQLKENLRKSRVQMEKQANKHRADVTFDVGAWVLLRLQPYRQQTIHKRVSQKLSQRYFGPFQIVKRVGEVAYLLDLPSSSRIHPVVHVSLLRHYHGTYPTTDFCPIPAHKSVSFIQESESETIDLKDDGSALPRTAIVSKVRDVSPSGHSLLKTRKQSVLAEDLEESTSQGLKRSNAERENESISEGELVLNTKQMLFPTSQNSSPKTATCSPSNGQEPLTCGKPCEQYPAVSHSPFSINTPPPKVINSPFSVSPTPHNIFPLPKKDPSRSPPPTFKSQLPSNSPSATRPLRSPSPNQIPSQPLFSPTTSLDPLTIAHNSENATNNLNLEDKVLIGPMSIDKSSNSRPTRVKKRSILLKNFYTY
ncbi:uncharacterized protein LOC131614035 [Vicia villosa]|uniref:uncharacterized protein LOC131614035 n=1 Tax=Vicia villosa TaxID=3911 RepID=UPI00273C737B|nr:uncharacterized protein LOC131614035 [Vicia villosa]